MAGRVMNDSDSHGSTRRTRRWQGYTWHIAVETQKFRIFLIVSGECEALNKNLENYAYYAAF
jgi:hypothetical protein